MSGERIAHYQVLDRLASGGMGVVYRARDLNLERTVALKLLPSELTDDPERRKRLLREARIAASLNHPSICTIHEVGEDCGRIFIAMELVPGTSLASILASGPVPAAVLLSVARAIAEGLAEAHASGIVHRDLKPQNIMVTPSGRTKILDFGLAKATLPVADDAATSSILSREGVLVGTLPYMSPEQVQGAALDARSDVFSFGVVLYQMATGRRPFQGDTAAAVAAEILKSDPEPLAVLRPDLLRGMARIIDRCLQKKPEDRYADGRELVTHLRAIPDPAGNAPQGRLGRRTWLIVPLLLVAAILSYRLVPKPAPRRQPSHKQLTFTGHATRPALSSDGRFLAYIDASHNPGRVVVQELAGAGGITVFEAQEFFDLRWSPDGSELIATSADPSGTYLIPRLGGTARRISDAFSHAAWAPDGKSLALSNQNPDTVFLVRRTGEAMRELKLHGKYEFVLGLEWSPTGSHILLSTSSGRGKAALWLLNVADGQETKLMEVSAREFGIPPHARWSRSGDALYYFLVNGRTTELWKDRLSKAGVLDGRPELLVTGLEAGATFTMAGDTQVAYTREARRSTLWLASRKSHGTDVEAVRLTTGTQTDLNPSVSPDGRELAFVRIAGPESNLFVMPLTGGAPRQLTFQQASHSGPAWSADGQEIAFVSPAGGSARVWVVPSSGGHPRVFERTEPSSASNTHTVAWAPGRQIVYQWAGHHNLGALDPASQKVTSLLSAPQEEGGWVFGPRYSPDAATLAVFWNRDRRGVWLIDVKSGQDSLLLEGYRLIPLGWSASGTEVFALDAGHELAGNRVDLVALSRGERRSFMTLPFLASADSVMTADGRLIAVVEEQTSDVWLMEDFDPSSDGR
jgi:serine/threonine protein kinase